MTERANRLSLILLAFGALLPIGSASAANPLPSVGPLSGGARILNGQVQVYCYRNTGTPAKPVWFLAQNTTQVVDGEGGAAVVHFTDAQSQTEITWIIWRKVGTTAIHYQYVASTGVQTGVMGEGDF